VPNVSILVRIFAPAIGGALGIALMIALAGVANLPLMLAPFTTSIVLVMSAPGSAFAPEAQGWLRWCFASKDLSRLTLGAERLRGWLAKL
jgi:CBS-domain-containing membrane protein